MVCDMAGSGSAAVDNGVEDWGVSAEEPMVAAGKALVDASSGASEAGREEVVVEQATFGIV